MTTALTAQTKHCKESWEDDLQIIHSMPTSAFQQV